MHWIDLTIMAAYIVGSMVAGLMARGEDDDVQDYFTAGGSLSGWFNTIVVGLSIAGTFFSGISFISYPSVVYSNGVLLPVWAMAVSMPLVFLVLRYWFLPRFLSGDWKFPYDVIEARYGAATRTLAAFLYIMMRIGWMAAMIYAPTVAVMTMGRLDDHWFWPIVLITGLTNTFYTVFSGIRGVIVTEAIQMLVIMVGIAATIVSVWLQIPVTAAEAGSHLLESGRLSVLNFSVDPKDGLTVFTVVIGLTVANLSNYVGDQMSLQRYLSTGDAASAGRSFIVNIIGVIIVVGLLTAVGLSMFVYFSFVNDPNLPVDADQVFPHFVATRLPIGVAGLLLAALLAATSIPSGINTLAGVLTLDFHARFTGQQDPGILAWWGRVYSLVIGLAATLAAGIVSSLGSIFESSLIVLGVFAGPLLSCVLLAVAEVRCSGSGMMFAMFAGWTAGVAVTFSGIAALWVAPASSAVTFLAALATQLLFSKVPRTDVA